MAEDLANFRRDYNAGTLSKKDLEGKNPLDVFNIWLKLAIESEIKDPTAMHLATADAAGKPSARIVLLKKVSKQGFIFYTNYNSRKGKEIAVNPLVCLTFWWAELQRMVIIEGSASKISETESILYFNSRPEESRIAACASPQSEVIPNKDFLTNKMAALTKEYKDNQSIPKPAHWGGYLVCPEKISFWQGGVSRLHDRFRFTNLNGNWILERIAP